MEHTTPVPETTVGGSPVPARSLSERVKHAARRHLPRAVRAWRYLRCLPSRFRPTADVFTEIYRTNHWLDPHTVSGTGSSLESTAAVRRALPGLLRELGAEVLLDAPCGDFYWMSHLDLDVRYIGCDIVGEIIDLNRARHGNDRRTFLHLDLIRDPLPRADVILCRDCLVHFFSRDVLRALRNFRDSGSTYLLTTTFTRRTENFEIATGGWRPLNLQLAPFGFPPPLWLLDEECTQFDGQFTDKHLGLWRLADLPL